LLYLDSPTKNREECIPVVRIERIDYRSHNQNCSSIADEDVTHTLRSTDENQQQENKRSRIASPISSGKKKYERTKKKNEKVCLLFKQYIKNIFFYF
jgi:hypothetical protein